MIPGYHEGPFGMLGTRIHLGSLFGVVLWGSPFEPKDCHCLFLADEIILLTGSTPIIRVTEILVLVLYFGVKC